MPFPKSQFRAPQPPLAPPPASPVEARALAFRFPNGAAVKITPVRISISGGHCRLYRYNTAFSTGSTLLREISTNKFQPGFSAMGLYRAVECSSRTLDDGSTVTSESGSSVWIHLTRRSASFFIDIDQALAAQWPEEFRARQARFDAASF